MYTYFDKLNEETKNWNNCISRNVGWYDIHYANGTTCKSNTKTGRYLGNGQYIED